MSDVLSLVARDTSKPSPSLSTALKREKERTKQKSRQDIVTGRGEASEMFTLLRFLLRYLLPPQLVTVVLTQ